MRMDEGTEVVPPESGNKSEELSYKSTVINIHPQIQCEDGRVDKGVVPNYC